MTNNLSLILVPGLMCDDAAWRDQVQALNSHCSLQVATHDLADSLGAMAERILVAAAPRFAIAGHSMGGRIALEVLARAPERVTHLALLDTGYEGFDSGAAGQHERAGRLRRLELARREGMLVMGKDWVQGMVHPARLADTELLHRILQMIARSSVAQYEAQINALMSRPDRSALLPSIKVPALVLCGREDAWSPLAQHAEMAAQIPGSVLIDVPECGHMSLMEQPQAVTQAMRSWLNI
jgi:pimeloyl-ACP methyl ester carboxylesterase